MAKKTSWELSGRKWTLKEAANLSPMSIAIMNVGERAELANFLYRNFNLRVSTFVQANTIPFALTKLLRDFNKIQTSEYTPDATRQLNLEQSPANIRKGRIYLSSMFDGNSYPGAALSSYISQLQSFFRAKSSTVKGWQEIGYAQDMRLFGAVMEPRKRSYNAIVRPAFRLTDDERRKFWAVWDEAKKAGWENLFGYDSGQAHREMASMWRSGNFNFMDIDEAYIKMEKMMLDKTKKTPGYYEEHKPGMADDPIQRGDVLEVGGDYFDS